MTYTKENLRNIFQQPYRQDVWNDILRELFHSRTLKLQPEVIEGIGDKTSSFFFGSLDTPDGYNIGLFRFDIKDSNIARKRVGLRQLVKHFINPKWGLFDAALVVFVGEDNWRLSFVCDIKGDATAPKRYTFLFGDKDNRYNTAVNRFIQLQEAGTTFANIKEAFSVEALSKEFYTHLYKWYEWALKKEMGITFPDILSSTNAEGLNIKIIRLLTRLLFVWFIKQKRLVPDELFSPDYLKTILKDFNKDAMDDGCFYNAILQNLFFATLNCPIEDDEGNHRSFATAKNTRDTKNKYRYSEMFLISEEQVIEMFSRIPYLNGGLFDCLDVPKYKKLDIEEDSVHDGFSRSSSQDKEGRYTQRAFIPNKLFFNEDENQPGLITLLKEYNFTVEENSTDDVEVSLDPELLGQVFENLLAAYNPETQESARKATGSFYTPRVIVDYMVDEALIAYLISKHIEGVNDKQLRQLFYEHTPKSMDNEQKATIIQALKEVKILDPACGSGAFPMGCLLRIVEIIEALDERQNRYELKIEIIENCVYGVDIQSIAMLICKLRFFISLICDQENIDFDKPEKNFCINTLPNLETKFVAANTLISAKITSNNIDSELFDDDLNKMKDDLLKIRNRYLLARSYKEKIACKNEDENKRIDIKNYIKEQHTAPNQTRINELKKQLNSLLEEKELLEKNEEILIQEQVLKGYDIFGRKITDVKNTSIGVRISMLNQRIQNTRRSILDEENKKLLPELESAIDQITMWNPYDQNSVSPFFNAEWMFCIKGGFDIVIGNPPFIQLKKLREKELYKSQGYETYESTGDIYCLFYEFATKIMNQKKECLGIFITSNKWLRAKYGLKLRNFLLKNTTPIKLIDLGPDVFEAAVDTNILLWKNIISSTPMLFADVYSENLRNAVFVPQSYTLDSKWTLMPETEKLIKKKVDLIATRILDFNVELHYGILNGATDVFILDKTKVQKLLSMDIKNMELIKPILRGKDIFRYQAVFADMYLLNLHNGIKKKHIPPVSLKKYPTIREYLKSFGPKFKQRGEQGDNWWNLRNCAYILDYEKPKILYSDIVQNRGKFYYDEEGYYTNDTAFMIVGENLKYLLAILNSKLFSYIYKSFYSGGGLGKNGLRFKKEFLQSVPIPKADSETKEILEEKVELILKMKKQNPCVDTMSYENEIDQIVYKLYGLDDIDIQIINANSNTNYGCCP